MRKIFALLPFILFLVTSTNAQRKKIDGLGLSLSYDIVAKGHGGSISVDTREYKYIAFTVNLPLS